MRIFYIFAIKEEVKTLTKESPYDLFHTLETIYYQKEEKVRNAKFLEQLIDPIKVKEFDILLFKQYKENYFYMKYKNIHSMHDVYRQENTILKLYKTYIKLETNVIKPRFLQELQKNPNLFVCDFEEKDYFWLESLSKLCMIG